MQEYSLAIKNEDFKRAAALRDEGGAGLVGWWVRDPSPSDPTGHLLRISPSYGRYLGLTFTARDIATHEVRRPAGLRIKQHWDQHLPHCWILMYGRSQFCGRYMPCKIK